VACFYIIVRIIGNPLHMARTDGSSIGSVFHLFFFLVPIFFELFLIVLAFSFGFGAVVIDIVLVVLSSHGPDYLRNNIVIFFLFGRVAGRSPPFFAGFR